MSKSNIINKNKLADDIKLWGKELGFQEIGFTNIDLSKAEKNLKKWLDMKFHGEMYYMEKHGLKRSRPDVLIPNTISVISARMNYLTADEESTKSLLDHPKTAYISRYALGRDYHKVLRQRLKRLGEKIEASVSNFGYRVFVDSAPVLEKPLAEKAGLGWIGKHTNLIDKKTGSWFFLGELYTDLALPISTPSQGHCGSCHECIDVCPTQAIIAPYVLDARRCISYLTIELRDAKRTLNNDQQMAVSFILFLSNLSIIPFSMYLPYKCQKTPSNSHLQDPSESFFVFVFWPDMAYYFCFYGWF